ncbi:MAG: hypothetical protein JRG96_10095 [Deltaproteobacteria bacterium]|nr:hypothetical protein [Deltaproteobacteria bacterium]MBW2417657.1 hypothetical protein [Deltaproteobacteria bacterium]
MKGRCARRPFAWGLALQVAATLFLAAAAAAQSALLDVEGMTFVGSRDGADDVLVRAETARFDTGEELAFLYTVHATVAASEGQFGFEVHCDSSELDLSSNDFIARGNVRGRTDGGRRFVADWVRYDHAEGLLFTDAPVLITDSAGSYRGGGFQYQVRERRFRLMGGASVVQEP